jgi:aspartate kinase
MSTTDCAAAAPETLPRKALDLGLGRAAENIADLHRAGRSVVAVVSGRPGLTGLVGLAGQVARVWPDRERHQLLAVAACTRAVLLALALQRLDVPAVALEATQSGVLVARRPGGVSITAVDVSGIRARLAQGQVVVVAGAQGVDPDGDILTLGPDGDRLVAGALAAGLDGAVRQLSMEGSICELIVRP